MTGGATSAKNRSAPAGATLVGYSAPSDLTRKECVDAPRCEDEVLRRRLDPLAAYEEADLTGDDEERLVLVAVDVERRGAAAPVAAKQLEESAVGLLGGELGRVAADLRLIGPPDADHALVPRHHVGHSSGQDRIARRARPTRRRRRGATCAPPTPVMAAPLGTPFPRMAAGRQGKRRVALADFVNSIGNYPSTRDLATVRVPVVCSYGARSLDFMPRLVQALASPIPTARTHQIKGAGHAAPFDATTEFVQLIAGRSPHRVPGRRFTPVEAETGRMEA
jgi:pimeloyl-ACP methyl ester carboxylesterase